MMPDTFTWITTAVKLYLAFMGAAIFTLALSLGILARYLSLKQQRAQQEHEQEQAEAEASTVFYQRDAATGKPIIILTPAEIEQLEALKRRYTALLLSERQHKYP